jgi:hypothetical protein
VTKQGLRRIFGLGTKRRKLASTIGISVRDGPVLEALIASSSQARATPWWGWSLREAATSTLTSGVIVKGLKERLVTQRVHPLGQSTAALEHWQTDPEERTGVHLRVCTDQQAASVDLGDHLKSAAWMSPSSGSSRPCWIRRYNPTRGWNARWQSKLLGKWWRR